MFEEHKECQYFSQLGQHLFEFDVCYLLEKQIDIKRLADAFMEGK